MASFKTSVILSLDNEGGYSNRPGSDLGGETYCGISRRYHASWPGWAIIDRIKSTRTIAQGEHGLVDLDLLMTFYRTEFWSKVSGDDIHNQTLANQVFDHALTAAPEDAIKLLQLACGVSIDGKLGPKTLVAVQQHIEADARGLNRRLFKLRTCFYLEAADKSLEQEANLPSWISRTLKCYTG